MVNVPRKIPFIPFIIIVSSKEKASQHKVWISCIIFSGSTHFCYFIERRNLWRSTTDLDSNFHQNKRRRPPISSECFVYVISLMLFLNTFLYEILDYSPPLQAFLLLLFVHHRHLLQVLCL